MKFDYSVSVCLCESVAARTFSTDCLPLMRIHVWSSAIRKSLLLTSLSCFFPPFFYTSMQCSTRHAGNDEQFKWILFAQRRDWRRDKCFTVIYMCRVFRTHNAGVVLNIYSMRMARSSSRIKNIGLVFYSVFRV